MQLIRFCFPHKTASMFAHKILLNMSKACGLSYFSPNNRPSNHMQLADHIRKRQDDIVLFGPSRSYGIGGRVLKALTAQDRVLDVCQIRHPLDVIVSQFFSHGWIHPDKNWKPETIAMRGEIQAGRVSVMDYARLELQGEAHFGGESLVKKLHGLNSQPDVTRRLIVRYEEFYHDYGGWSQKIVDFLPAGTARMKMFLRLQPDYTNAVVLPEGSFYSDPLEYIEAFDVRRGKHIRAAAPGDHAHFLTAAESAQLMGTLRAAWPDLGMYYGQVGTD